MAMAMQVALLTRWEWFKLRHRWIPWILLGFVLVTSQLVFWLVAVLSDDFSFHSPAENMATGLEFASLFSAFIAVILAASVAGSEYGWGTLRPVLSKGAGRWPFLTSKLAVVLLFTAALLLILSVTLMISGFIAEAVLTAPEAEGDISWLDLLAVYCRMVYGLLPYIALALFMVVLTGSNGFGIGVSMGYYIAESYMVVPILVAFDWSDLAYAFLLSPNVTAWQSPPGGGGLDIADTIATIGGMSEMAHGFILVTIYTVVLAAVALALFLRRDITGAKGG